MKETDWDELRNHLEAIGGRKMAEVKVDPRSEKMIDEEMQLQHLVEMAFSDLKKVMREWRLRLEAENLHLKAEIAKLQQDKAALTQRIAGLEKEKANILSKVEDLSRTLGIIRR